MAEINRLQERHRLEVHIGRARIEDLERQLAATATVSVQEAMAGLALSRPAQELLERNTKLQADIRALREQVVENRTGFVKTLASQRALEHTLHLRQIRSMSADRITGRNGHRASSIGACNDP